MIQTSWQLGMNAPTNADAAQAATRGSQSRGRGGRGGRGNSRVTAQRGAVSKDTPSKIGPSRLLEVDWTKDSVLKDNCFVMWLGTGQAGDQQWTYHRPIGETTLLASQWVATPTRDISYLLQRRESEALASWKRRAELAKRQAVLAAQNGRKIAEDGSTEIWSFADAPAIQPTIRSCMTAAKAAGANESEWLTYADRAVQTAERSFKEALRTQAIPDDWVRNNPRPAHETKGGALGDQPQKAVPFLDGLSLSAAKDKCVRVAIGIDTAENSGVGQLANPMSSRPSTGTGETEAVSHSAKLFEISQHGLGPGFGSVVYPSKGKNNIAMSRQKSAEGSGAPAK